MPLNEGFWGILQYPGSCGQGRIEFIGNREKKKTRINTRFSQAYSDHANVLMFSE